MDSFSNSFFSRNEGKQEGGGAREQGSSEEDRLGRVARYAPPGNGEDTCLAALRASLVGPNHRARILPQQGIEVAVAIQISEGGGRASGFVGCAPCPWPRSLRTEA